ncbi:hypothetical protein M9H77_22643 [Catharanthus roseus]|uniref:Uncharacterized protein n=1 Tax=Catharanthus roseus TaxID=4058 RepID=A0ACC0ASR3_CATRO|nr:hypothetical protein M9H77_22643 [Catharanthus roseus]
MQCNSRAPWTKFESQNEVIGTKFWHLLVNTSQTPDEHSISIITDLPKSIAKPGYRFLGHNYNPGRNGVFTCIYKPKKGPFLAVGTKSGHKYFRSAKIPIRQSSHGYANFTNMPNLHSCMSNHVHLLD